jgi:ribosomal protein L40E
LTIENSICDYCGAENPPSAKFCVFCDNPLNQDVLQEEIPELKIEKPAKPLVKCNNCGIMNPEDNEYCCECQLELRESDNPKSGVQGRVIRFKAEKSVFNKYADYIKCEECGELNSPDHASCIRCQLPLDSYRKNIVKEKLEQIGLKSSSEQKTIQCKRCGAINRLQMDCCVDCGLVFTEEDKMSENRLNVKLFDGKTRMCANCGALNPVNVLFCRDCQIKLLEIDYDGNFSDNEGKKVTTVLVYPKDNEHIICNNCGGCNKKENVYCKDCAMPLR